MKLEQNSTTLSDPSNRRVSKRNAYHHAGQIAAIYLGNKRKLLPSVHFQLVIKPVGQETGFPGRFARIQGKQSIKLEGGRLITDLPISYETATSRLTPAEKQQCQDAFEADVINLLAGSLAEAKYVAQRDGEVFNANLVYLGALRCYGGVMDLEIINEYMACMMPGQPEEQQSRLAVLFLEAYSFINERANWFVITALADRLVNSPLDIFTCEELIHLIESANPVLPGFQVKTNSFALVMVN